MKRLHSILFVLGSFVLCAAAEKPLTLDACLAGAAENNPDLIAAKEAVQKAEYQVRASRADHYPQLSANADAGRSHRESSVDDMSTDTSTRSDSRSVGVSAKQSLFTGGRNRAAIEQSAAAREIAVIQLAQIEAQLSYDVKEAFSQLLFAQEQVVLAQTIAKRRKDNADLVQLRYEGGREHKGSYLRIKAAYSQAGFEVLQAQRALRVAQRRLARAMGRRETGRLAVKGELKTAKPAGDFDFLDLARATPEYRISVAQVRAAKAGVASAKSQLYPDVSAGASASRSGDDWPPRQDEWSVGLNLSYPFFPGGKNLMTVQSAKAEQRRVEAGARSSEDQIALNLEQAFAGFEDAAGRVDVQDEFLKAAEMRAEIARTQYTSGLLSFENWDLIENDLIDQQKNLLAGRRDAVIAEANWENTRGLSRLPSSKDKP